MWALSNDTPYKVESTWGRNFDGIHEWIVAVKATYDINPDGTTSLSKEQLEPLIQPEYYGEPGLSSLQYDADLVPPKPTTDIVLNATAYAPEGKPSKNFEVSLQVDDKIFKKLRITGNRWYEKSVVGIQPSAIKPVTEVPITYERAYGGYFNDDPNPKNHRLDSKNPVGCGIFGKSEDRVGRPLPNLEYPGGNIKKVGPAGFGAIDCFWSPRREFQGTYGKKWEENRRPLLPDDWDSRSLCCSPLDQQPKQYLRGGEEIELINLTPNSRLCFSLPKIYPSFRTEIKNQEVDHRCKLSSVIIEPDYPRLIMVWVSALICNTDVDYLEETLIYEKEYI